MLHYTIALSKDYLFLFFLKSFLSNMFILLFIYKISSEIHQTHIIGKFDYTFERNCYFMTDDSIYVLNDIFIKSAWMVSKTYT